MSCLPPDALETKPGSIGRAIPGVRLTIQNEEGREVLRGETGEIVAEEENIAQGYWRAPEETARTFRDGRLYTGALATVDEDGFIFIVGRERDFLKYGGTRVSCKQLEQQLLGMEDLVEAAVIGVPDEMLGESVNAFVVPRAEANGIRERVAHYCKERLPVQFIPPEIVVLKALPKNAAGKILKSELRSR